MEFDALDMRVGGPQGVDHLPASVGAAVVYKDHLVGEPVLLHDPFDPAAKLG